MPDETLLSHKGVPPEPSQDPQATLRSSVVPEPPPPSSSGNAAPTWQNTPAVNMYDVPFDSFQVPVVSGAVRGASAPPPPPPLSRETAARIRARRRRSRSRRSGGEWAWVIVAGAIFSLVLLIGMSGVLIVRNMGSSPEIVPTATLDVALLPPAVDLGAAQDQGGDGASNNLVVLGDGTPVELKPWDGETRFTVLLMGIDRRPGDRSLAHLTDTMLLISIDPATKRIGVLSIPRDLYVQVPGYSELQRINTAMVLGEIRSPGSGPQLAMQTVQYNLGVRVHEYILLDFRAAIDLVNAIGGIEVTTNYTIDDPYYPDMYYGYDPFYLPAGTHQLDGEQALKYARTRHGDSDLERARRQQEVIFAVRDRVTSLDMLPDLVMQAPALLASLDDNLYTGLDLQEMIELAFFAREVPMENITTGVIDYGYVQDYTTSRGEQVLIPNRASLGGLLSTTFGENYAD